MLKTGTSSACAIAGTAVFRIVVSKDSMKNPTATSQGSSRLAVAVSAMSSEACQGERLSSARRQRRVDDALRLADQAAQMRIVMKALGVNLVDVLGSRRARREPAAARGDLHAADRRVVARRLRQDLFDRFAREFA